MDSFTAKCADNDDFVIIDYEDVCSESVEARFAALKARDELPLQECITSIPAVARKDDSCWSLKMEDGHLKLLWLQTDEKFLRLSQNQVGQFHRHHGFFDFGKKYNFAARVSDWVVDGGMCFFLTDPVFHQGRMTVFKIHVLWRNCDIVDPMKLKSILDIDINYRAGKMDGRGRRVENVSANLSAISMRHLASEFVKTLILSRR